MRDFKMTYSTNRQTLSLRVGKFSKKVGTFPRKPIVRKKRSASPLTDLAVKLVERQQRANFNYYMDSALTSLDNNSCLKGMEKEKSFKGFSSEERLRMTQLTHFSAGRIKRMTSEGVYKFYANGKSKGVDGLTKIPALNQNPENIFQYGCCQKSKKEVIPPPALSLFPLSAKEEKKIHNRGMIMYGPGWKIRQLIKSKSIDEIVALHVKKSKMERGELGNESNLAEECPNHFNKCNDFQSVSAGGSQTRSFSSPRIHHHQQTNSKHYIPLQPGSFQIKNKTVNSCPLQQRRVNCTNNYNYNMVSVPTSMVNSSRKRKVRKLPSIIRNGGAGVREENPQIVYNCSDDLYNQLKQPTSSLHSLDNLMRSNRNHGMMMMGQGYSTKPSVDKKISPPTITLDGGKLLSVQCGRSNQRVNILIQSSNTYDIGQDTESEYVDVEEVSDDGSLENPILIDD